MWSYCRVPADLESPRINLVRESPGILLMVRGNDVYHVQVV